MHNRAGARVRNSLPANGDLVASPRDRDREAVALPGRIRVFGACNHASQRLAFWGCVASTAGAGTRVLALPSLLARPRTAHLRVSVHSTASPSILGLLSIAW